MVEFECYAGQSYNTVVSQLGTTYDGFNVASLDQVAQFFLDAGITPINTSPVSGTNPAVDLLLHSWGITDPLPMYQQNATFAFTSNTSPSFPGSNNIAVLEEWGTDPAINQVAGWAAGTGNNNFDPNSVAYSIIATALIRKCDNDQGDNNQGDDNNQCNEDPAAAIPLPGTLPLFASGLGALGLLGWRRKRKAQGVA